MNNCRAGLYGFTATTTWLSETGMASPPFLVMLGLILPDSRILNGIAGIGLTLADIAITLPHLRQPILDSIHWHASERAHHGLLISPEPEVFSAASNTTQPVDIIVDNPGPALAVTGTRQCPRDGRCQNGSSANVKFVCSAVARPLECLSVCSKVALLPAQKTDNDQTLQVACPNADTPISFNNPFVRDGRSALHVPLPVPDAEEVAFFDATDTSLFDRDLDLEVASVASACEQSEEDSASEDDGLTAIRAGIYSYIPFTKANYEKDTEQGGHRVTVGCTASEYYFTHVPTARLFCDEYVTPLSANLTTPDHRNPHILQGVQARHLIGDEVPAKRRPESLNFIPHSVIRRYPSAVLVSAERYRAFSSRHDRQFTLAPPHTSVHNSELLPSGTLTQTGNTALERHATHLAEVGLNTHPTRGLEHTLVIEDPMVQDLVPELPTVHQLTTLKMCPARPRHERQLGILTRATHCNRKSTARRRGNTETDRILTSDSDSDHVSDSPHSSESSADDHMLPHMLGTDLIAAIDANSESELNLTGSRTIRTPLAIYEDFLVSDDSAADVSMIMQVSSHDDAIGKVKVPVTLRSLTYEDIQQWASGVVQKCVKQACRSRAPMALLSPSQASDVCAERPSSSGISQCPLSGLHCKLQAGAATSAQIPASKIRELPPTPGQKPLLVQNVRVIPEFVPCQRHVSVATRRVEGPRKPSTGSTIDTTHDAATEVIARMESHVGFNSQARKWLTDEIRRASTVRGRQVVPRRRV